MSQSSEASTPATVSGQTRQFDNAPRDSPQSHHNARAAALEPTRARRGYSDTNRGGQDQRVGGNTESWQDFLRQVAPQDIAQRDPNDPVRLAYIQSRYEEARRRRRALTMSGGMASSSTPADPTYSAAGSSSSGGSALHAQPATRKRPMSLQFQNMPLPMTPLFTESESSVQSPPAPVPISSNEYSLPRWQPDEEVPNCPICGRTFGVFFRRHHCRKCGRVVCASCSPHRITIPRQFIVRPPAELLQNTDRANRRSMLVDLTHSDNEEQTGGDDDLEGTLSRTDSNPALGGGQEVRLCNPCVPDPNPLPPPSYLSPSGQHFGGRAIEAGYGASRNRHVPVPPIPHATHPTSHTYHQGAGQSRSSSDRSRVRQSWAPGAAAYDIPTPQSPSNQRTPYGSAPSGTRHYESHWPFQSSPSSRIRPTSFFYAPPPRTSSITNAPLPPTPPAPAPPVREEDECPVCHAELPPRGPQGEETAREAHVSECIASHFSAPSSSRPPPEAAVAAAVVASSAGAEQARGNVAEGTGATLDSGAASGASALGRKVSTRRRTTGMVVYPATEKDCVGEDGVEQECVICFEEFTVGAEMGRLECLCKFHRACIRMWWDTKGVGSCPVHQDGLGA